MPFIFFHFQVLSQDKKIKFPFHEFSISANRTNVATNGTENRNGFGLGIYRYIVSKKIINLTLGLEYNRTSQFKKSMYAGHFYNFNNVTLKVYNISIPLLIRISTGNKFKIFAEAGSFIDIIPYAEKTGTFSGINPYTYQYSSNLKTENAGLNKMNFGFSGGIGLLISASEFDVIIKPDYIKPALKLNNDTEFEDIFNNYFRIVFAIRLKEKTGDTQK